MGRKKRQQEFKRCRAVEGIWPYPRCLLQQAVQRNSIGTGPRKGRGRKVSEEELREYQLEIGQKEYRRILSYTCNRSARIRDNDLRASGKHYGNTPEKLEAIKEKYRNGVTDDIMKEFESKLAATENPFCP